MIDILKKLRTAKRETAADIKAALCEINLPGLQKDLDAATAKRDALLLDGSDKELTAAEAAVIATRSTLERVTAVRGQLEQRLAAAEKAEADAALTAERDRVNAEADKLAADLRAKWPALQREMVALLERLHASNDAVGKVNQQLGEAGRGTEVLTTAEWRWRPRPQYAYEGAVSISTNTVLMDLPEWKAPGYGWRENTAGLFLVRPREPVSTENWPQPFARPPEGLTIFPAM